MSTVFLHFNYLRPKSIKEACSLLSKHAGKAMVISGGTDLKVLMRNKDIAPQYVIDLNTIPDLDYIRQDREGLKIGTLATLHAVESSPIIQERFPMLAAAARQIGSPQIRNMGTIGGNLCNATPSADTPPPLIGLGAKVKIVGLGGERIIGLEGFFVGPDKTVLQGDEILTEIQVPEPPAHTGGVYLTFPERRAVDRTAVGVAAVVTLDSKGEKIVNAKIVLGTVAPTPIRAGKAEDTIKGKAIDDELIEQAAQAASKEARPRTRHYYKRQLVKVLTRQAIRQAIDSARLLV